MEMSKMGHVCLGNLTAHAQCGRGCDAGVRARCCQAQNFQDKPEAILRNYSIFKVLTTTNKNNRRQKTYKTLGSVNKTHLRARSDHQLATTG